MRTLARPVLVGGVGSGGLDDVAGLGKEVDDGITFAKVATKVKANVCVRGIGRETVLYKPAVKEGERRGLGAEGSAVEGPAVMIDDQTVAGLAM